MSLVLEVPGVPFRSRRRRPVTVSVTVVVTATSVSPAANTQKRWKGTQALRPYRFGSSAPAFMSTRMAVGAVYQTVTF